MYCYNLGRIAVSEFCVDAAQRHSANAKTASLHNSEQNGKVRIMSCSNNSSYFVTWTVFKDTLTCSCVFIKGNILSCTG